MLENVDAETKIDEGGSGQARHHSKLVVSMSPVYPLIGPSSWFRSVDLIFTVWGFHITVCMLCPRDHETRECVRRSPYL